MINDRAKKIYLIDYNCVVDSDNKPLGHTLGLAEKLISILEKMGQCVTYVCAKEYAEKVDFKNKLVILKSIKKPGMTAKEERNILKNNFSSITENIENGINFFIHMDLTLSGLLPRQTRSRKNICICFSNIRERDESDNFFKSILRKLYFNYHNQQFKHKVDVVIKTNKKLKFKNRNVLYMPDYFYMPEQYEKYNCGKQANKVVCLGQNNAYKKIIPLVEKFKDSNFNLVIRGKFFDEKIYKAAKEIACGYKNICLEDSNISEEEYFNELASAQFCILPYDNDFYFERTSGIAIEAMFLNSIVIGPAQILDFNDIPGIKYNSLPELDLSLLNYSKDILDKYSEIKNEEYSYDFTFNTIDEAIKLIK